MPLDRVTGQPFNALVAPRGQAVRELVSAWPPTRPHAIYGKAPAARSHGTSGPMTWPKRFPRQTTGGTNGNVLPSGIDTGSHRRRGRDHGGTLVRLLRGCPVR